MKRPLELTLCTTRRLTPAERASIRKFATDLIESVRAEDTARKSTPKPNRQNGSKNG